MKRKFNIKFRPQIESGEYKVQTRNGRKARIVCWDRKSKDLPILALVYFSDEDYEEAYSYFIDGHFYSDEECDLDLFILTEEPELTEFEKTLLSYLSDDTSGELDKETMHRCVKARAEELLAIAKKKLCNGCSKCFDEYWRGRKEAVEEVSKGYHYEGPYIPTHNPCPYGGECTNPFRGCINCPRQSTIDINTTTRTSISKLEGNNNG